MIEETIQWFTPDEKLPDDNTRVLYISKAKRRVENGYFKKFYCIDKQYWHEDNRANIPVKAVEENIFGRDVITNTPILKDDIIWWAYLPRGPQSQA